MSKEKLSELLPCPFCGGEAVLRYFFEENPVSISCTNEKCVWSRMALRCETEEQGIGIWNEAWRMAHE